MTAVLPVEPHTGCASIPLTRGLVAIVDESDVPAVTGLSWYAHATDGQGWYARTSMKGSGHRVMMHTLLTGWPLIDHVNRNGLDNRRHNLRPATRYQNGQNKRASGGSSRYKGVSWRSDMDMWQARIGFNGRRISLGFFHDESVAARAYDAAARELHHEFATLNFPRPGERSAL